MAQSIQNKRIIDKEYIINKVNITNKKWVNDESQIK